MEMRKTNPWMWLGVVALLALFCCCGVIVALAVFGPMLDYYSGSQEGGNGLLVPFAHFTFLIS